MKVTWQQVLAWRTRRHLLHPQLGGPAVDVIRRLGGVQAQVASAARLAVAVRQRSPQRAGADVQQALTKGTLLRTWAMRGTLHLLPADTAPALLSLLAAARTWEKGSWQRTFADAATMARLAEAVPAALDGPPLTREELVAAVAGHPRDAALAEQLGSGWSTVLKPLAWQGLLCQGPSVGNRITFTRPDRCLPWWPGLAEPDAAAAAVVRGYLGAYGPATPEAFDQWLLRGASRRADLRRWFAELGDDAVRVEVEGSPGVGARTAYLLAEHADDLAGTRASGAVHLLPAFDQFVLGPGTGDPAVVPPAHRARVSRAAGWIAPVLLVGGWVAGTWEPSPDGPRVEPFPDTPPPDPGLLAREVARLASLQEVS